MAVFLDGDSDVQASACSDCGAEYLVVKSFIVDEVGPFAIGMTSLHHHDGLEAWIDVIFGSFEEAEGTDPSDRFTFGCRVGDVEGSPAPAATPIQAGGTYGDSPTFGRKLSREEALAHPRIDDFWSVVDFLLESEPAINDHMYGHRNPGAQANSRWWHRK